MLDLGPTAWLTLKAAAGLKRIFMAGLKRLERTSKPKLGSHRSR